MAPLLLRIVNGGEWSSRAAITVLCAVLLAAAGLTALQALGKTFWYDETITVIVCALPGAADVWKALDDAIDTNPPAFYFVSRLLRPLVTDEHLGYRLPSLLGLLGTLTAVYFTLARRVNRLSALVGAAFLLCTPLAVYAYEARPYALVLAGMALAILAWQRADEGPLYQLLLAAALALAVSQHYYAIFIWPAFAGAEAAVFLLHRRIRYGVWVALGVGVVPLVLAFGLLARLRVAYGKNFWSHPGLGQMFGVHDWLFSFGSHWGLTFAVGLTVLFLYWGLRQAGWIPAIERRPESVAQVPAEEWLLALLILWMPVVAIIAAKIGQGGMTERYMLPAVLGGALAVGYLTDRTPAAVRTLLFVLLLMNFGLSSLPILKSALQGHLYDSRTASASQIQNIIDKHNEPSLPVVISSGLMYLPRAYYTVAPAAAKRLYAVTDPPASLRFRGSDSVDLALLIIRRYAPLQVEDYAGFISRHREFLLITGDGEGFDWWPSRLLQDHHSLQLLSLSGGTRVYKVTLRM